MSRKTQRWFWGLFVSAILFAFSLFYFFPDSLSFSIFAEKKKLGLFYKTVGNYTKDSSGEGKEKVYYTLEFAVFETEEEARKEVDTLAEKSIAAFYTPFETKEGLFYQVRRGLYADKKAAEEEALRLAPEAKLQAKPLKF